MFLKNAPYRPLLLALALTGGSFACSKGCRSISAAEQLELVTEVTIPIKELSGLTRCGDKIFAVGDRDPLLVEWKPATSQTDPDFKLHKITGLPSDSQWEAVACDDNGRVYVLRENPPTIFALDLEKKAIHQKIDLAVDRQNFPQWYADPNSQGEGLVVLSAKGELPHFLVLKEKLPTMLIEFGPQGQPSRIGQLSATAAQKKPLTQALVPNPASFTYVPIARWDIKFPVPIDDLSDLERNEAGHLLAISDQQPFILRLHPPDKQKSTTFIAEILWRLPTGIKHTEGLAWDAKAGLLVGVDKKKTKDNAFVLRAK